MKRQVLVLRAPKRTDFFDKVAAVGGDEAAKGIGMRIIAALLDDPNWGDGISLDAVYGIELEVQPQPDVEPTDKRIDVQLADIPMVICPTCHTKHVDQFGVDEFECVSCLQPLKVSR